MDIPDINVWLALVDQNHTHHASAASYWQDISNTEVAFTAFPCWDCCAQHRCQACSVALTRPLAWESIASFCPIQNHRFLMNQRPSVPRSLRPLPHRSDDAHCRLIASDAACLDADFALPWPELPAFVAVEKSRSRDAPRAHKKRIGANLRNLRIND
jgi:hypothetical protein